MLHSAPPTPSDQWPRLALQWLFNQTNPNKPKTKPLPDLLHISYLLIMQLDSWISEVLQWVRFAKKAFSPALLSLLSFPNALRPDCPSRQFRGQQNSSENSESAESTEETESTERTEAPVFELSSDRHSCLHPGAAFSSGCVRRRWRGRCGRSSAGRSTPWIVWKL